MMQMAAQSFKVTFEGETRRLPASDLPTHDFDAFSSSLTSLFPSAKGKVLVQYTDSDGDRVTVRSTAELSESFLALTGPCRAFDLRHEGQGHTKPENQVPVCRVTPGGAQQGAEPQKPKQQRPKEAMEEAARLSAAGRPTEARDLLARTVEAFPHSSLCWVRLAASHACLGSTAEALEAFERGVDEGFGNIKLSLSDEGLQAIRSHPRFTARLLSMAKGKFEKGEQPGAKGVGGNGATLGGFLASKVLFFRTAGGVAPADALAFAQACLNDPKVDPCAMLLYQSSVAAAANGEGDLAVNLLRRAAEAGFRFPGKVRNEPAFDAVRPQLEGLVRAIHANKKAVEQKEGDEPQTAPTRQAITPIPAPPPESDTTATTVSNSKETAAPLPTHPELATLRALGFATPDSVLVALLEQNDGDVSRVVAALLGA